MVHKGLDWWMKTGGFICWEIVNLKPQWYIYLKVSFDTHGEFSGCIAASQPGII